MKRDKYHMLRTWILLVCFIAGQLMVFVHQHPDSAGAARIYTHSKTADHQIVKEKCYMCDVMHHNAMMATYQVFLKPVPFIAHSFNVCEYKISALKLISAGGRAPPRCHATNIV
ncbi:hypothetical protein [uncultured Mucilaginibacter sp.]|uniref:hypothetical protein n=1 Tax=uncultured Mucilaginibacter sp. TaxID=797541 RepID=UPI0025E5281C|nr:hypothetical protein [uncultured Mucilaginibacter sp.]